MTRPRLTVRRLMVGVALVGLALGLGLEVIRLWRLSARYEKMAVAHEINASKYRELAANPDSMASSWWSDAGGTHSEGLPTSGADKARRARLAGYHARMAGHYRQAARRPWAPIVLETPPTD